MCNRNWLSQLACVRVILYSQIVLIEWFFFIGAGALPRSPLLQPSADARLTRAGSASPLGHRSQDGIGICAGLVPLPLLVSLGPLNLKLRCPASQSSAHESLRSTTCWNELHPLFKGLSASWLNQGCRSLKACNKCHFYFIFRLWLSFHLINGIVSATNDK